MNIKDGDGRRSWEEDGRRKIEGSTDSDTRTKKGITRKSDGKITEEDTMKIAENGRVRDLGEEGRLLTTWDTGSTQKGMMNILEEADVIRFPAAMQEGTNTTGAVRHRIIDRTRTAQEGSNMTNILTSSTLTSSRKPARSIPGEDTRRERI